MTQKERHPGGSNPGVSKLSRRQAAEERHGNASQEGEQLDLLAVRPAQFPVDHSGRDGAEENTDQWWADCGMEAIRAAAASGVVFQAYDLCEVYGLVEPDSPKRWGALLGRAAKAGVIVLVGATPSRRPSAHGALCRTWRGAA